MTISYVEQRTWTCPSCGQNLSGDIWLILDAEEHPEAVTQLQQGHLNVIQCIHCHYRGVSDVPLLFHSRPMRAVIFAAVPGVPEHRWQEQARELHALLVGSIALEDRKAYLGDVQIAQDVAGMAHLLQKLARRTARTTDQEVAPATTDTPQPAAQQIASTAETFASVNPDMLMTAIEQLMTADTPEACHQIIQQYPVLLSPETDTALTELIGIAEAQYEHDVAVSLEQMRTELRNYRQGNRSTSSAPMGEVEPIQREPVATSNPIVHSPSELAAPDELMLPPLDETIYQALLQVQTSEELRQLIEAYPIFKTEAIDAVLRQKIEEVLIEGYEYLAQELEHRRELVLLLRQEAAGMASQGDSAGTPTGNPGAYGKPRRHCYVRR